MRAPKTLQGLIFVASSKSIHRLKAPPPFELRLQPMNLGQIQTFSSLDLETGSQLWLYIRIIHGSLRKILACEVQI